MKASLQKCFAMLTMAICLPAAALLISGICMLLFAGKGAGTRDFVSYLASGRLLAQRSNPYDSDAVLRIELAAGYPAGYPSLIMRNPPSASLPALPLGYVSARTGAILWAWLSLAALVASVQILWTMYGRPKGLVAILGYTFGPALACLLANQISLFALFGLVLFLRLHKTYPFVSGLALWFCALKPHLLLPFAVVLILWIIVTRSYRILAGAITALAVGTAIPMFLDPAIWAQYHQMMAHHSGMDTEFIPCLSIALRFWISPRSTWLQYVPSAIACIWAVRYYWKHRADWDWMTHGSLLALVSLLAAPYSWIFDQVLAIPALMHGAYRVRAGWMLGILALASGAIEILIITNGLSFHSAAYLWTAPAWLLWYLSSAPSREGGRPTTAPLPGDSLLMEW